MPLQITVRNGLDPLLLAKQLSKGTFDFGLSSHDMKVVGFLGLVVSILWLIRPCIVVCSVRGVCNYTTND